MSSIKAMTAVPPDVWGPPFWRAIHYAALGSPERPTPEDRRAFAAWLSALPTVLPCQACADHFSELLRREPPTDERMSSVDALFRYTVDLHNHVNARLGKPQLTVQQAHTALVVPELAMRCDRLAALVFLMASLAAIACRYIILRNDDPIMVR
jgi:uncharacterized protein (DUF2236 family)